VLSALCDAAVNGQHAMTAIGPIVFSFFEWHLKADKAMSPASIKSYRDAVKLFLTFVASESHRAITSLDTEDLTAARVREFLTHLEIERGNHIRTCNQRLAGLHALFTYLAEQAPETLAEAQKVAAIPRKKSPPPGIPYLERDELEALFAGLPTHTRAALRDRALLLFLYNTGARVQEAADLTVDNLFLQSQPRVELRGKGNKSRNCPLWPETARLLQELLGGRTTGPVFTATHGRALTRFGIYKLVRRHTAHLSANRDGGPLRHVSPRVMRHSTATQLLKAGVERDVVGGRLGRVNLSTTNRYAEASVRSKVAQPGDDAPVSAAKEFPGRSIWPDDKALLDWLASL
jgi:integrase/recombinase XerD